MNLTYICPCHFGLESVLSGEIKRLGGQDVIVTDGKVTFSGDEQMMAKANISLRTAERVLIKLAEFKAYSFEDLFQGVLSVPLEDFIGKNDAFPVKGWSLNSKLHSIPDCQSIIKKAAVERLKKHYKINWFEETGSIHQLQFSIHKDTATLMLDTSGAGLHKRGYRKNSNDAPIKETLAAGIVDLARVKGNTIMYDPFCGSGTFSIESALKAFNIPSGINRKFSAEKWGLFPEKIWKEARKYALEQIRKDAEFRAFCSDIDINAVQLTKENAKKAGVGSKIDVSCADIKDFICSSEKATIICNPPYGERLLELKQAEEIYKTMGKVFELGKNKSYYIISPHEDFEKFFGTKASKRRKLYNGMIKCQLFMYF